MRFRVFRRWVWVTWLFLFFVIAWGALVRATGSGAGCGSHWPTCNGEVLPRTPTVQTVIEYTHRLTSGLSGVLVLAVFVGAFWLFPKRHPVRASSVGLLVFLVLEAAIGAGIVKFEWVAHQVSVSRALSMAVHLVNTFFLLFSATVVLFHSREEATPLRMFARWKEALGVGSALFGLLLTGLSGTVAALGDTLLFVSVPLGAVDESHVLLQTFLKLRVAHPLLAVLFVGWGLWVSSVLHRQKALEKWARALALGMLLQLGVGLLNVVWKAPVSLQLLHLLLADALWVTWVWVLLKKLAAPSLESLPVERAWAHVSA